MGGVTFRSNPSLPEENNPKTSQKQVEKNGKTFTVIGTHREKPVIADKTEQVEKPIIGTHRTPADTAEKIKHSFSKTEKQNIDFALEELRNFDLESGSSDSDLHFNLKKASTEHSSTQEDRISSALAALKDFDPESESPHSNLDFGLKPGDLEKMEENLTKLLIKDIETDVDFSTGPENKTGTIRKPDIEKDVDFDSEFETSTLSPVDKKRLEDIEDDVDFGDPSKKELAHIEHEVDFDNFEDKAPIQTTPHQIDPKLEKQTQVANILSSAINSNTIDDVRKVIDLAKKNNVDMTPIITICLNSHHDGDVHFLLTLKTVLALSNPQSDLTQINREIEKAFSAGFKKSIESNDLNLLKSLVYTAEQYHPDPVLQRFSEKIIDKFEGLQKNESQELHNLDPLQMLKICAVAELKLHEGSPENKTTYVKKTEHDLSHSLLIDHKQKTYTIILKETIAEGSQGKVKNAIVIADHLFNETDRSVTVTSVARKVSLDKTSMSSQEIEYQAKYGDMQSYTDYTSGNDEKITFTMEKFTCNLTKITKQSDVELAEIMRATLGKPDALEETEEPDIPSIAEKCRVLYDAALTLAKMHDDGVIHDDIKGENILYRRLDNGEVQGKLADFGTAYEPGNKSERGKSKGDFPGYGSVAFMSPEVLRDDREEQVFTLNDKKAHDAYAFGCTAYELILEEAPEWFEKIPSVGAFLNPANRESAVSIQEEIKQKAQELEMNIMLGESESDEDKALLLVYRLLDPNPATRMTINDFLKEITPLMKS